MSFSPHGRLAVLLLLLAQFPAVLSTDSGFGAKPNIVVLLADNVGWANVGFHKPPLEPHRDVYSPNIDTLAYSGLRLDRHYTYKFCSPSRSSFLTGRLPVHVNIYNDNPAMPGAGLMRVIHYQSVGVGFIDDV